MNKTVERTKDLVISSLVNSQPMVEVPNHEVRLRKLYNLPQQTSTQEKYSLDINRLKAGGFHMFVDSSIEDKFKYKAGLRNSYRVDRPDLLFFLGLLFCLVAISTGVAAVVSKNMWFVTPMLPSIIASIALSAPREPIYTEIRNYSGDIPDSVLDNLDLLSGYENKPIMIYSCKPLPLKTIKVFPQTDPVMVCWISRDLGVVVGIWDRDKEVKVLDRL